MSQCIAVLLLLISLLGTIMAAQSIQQVNWLRTFLKSDPAFSSAVNDAFNDPTNSKLILRLCIYLGASTTQFLMSVIGLVAVSKSMSGLYKVYFGATLALAVVRVVLLFMMPVRWHVVLAVVVNMLALYPMHVYLPVVQERAAAKGKPDKDGSLPVV